MPEPCIMQGSGKKVRNGVQIHTETGDRIMAAIQAVKGLNLPQNMGQMDRIIRSAIGGALLVNGLSRPQSLLCRLGEPLFSMG